MVMLTNKPVDFEMYAIGSPSASAVARVTPGNDIA
jgi:hypothetical protein